MRSAALAANTAVVIGVLQLLANGLLLVRGFTRLPRELAAEGATARVADLLRVAWPYGMLGNLCLAVILLACASALRVDDPLARRVAISIGVYYLLLGAVAYGFAAGRHAGLLVFSLFGVVLLAAVWR